MKHRISFWAAMCLIGLFLSSTEDVLAQPGFEIRSHPVILVHGINDVDSNWDRINEPIIFSFLTKDGYDPFYVTTFAYVQNQRRNALEDDEVNDIADDSYQDISTVAEYLKSEVDYLFQQSGGAKVDIVAYSLGGIVTREYLRKFCHEQKICRFVDIATPHSGSSLFGYYDSLPKVFQLGVVTTLDSLANTFGYRLPDPSSVAAQQLVPNSVFLHTLNSTISPPDVEYWMLYGDIQFEINTGMFWFGMISNTLTAGDLVVSRENAATIPNLGSFEGTNKPSYYNTKGFVGANKLELVANIQINLKELEVKIEASMEAQLDDIEPYWHGGLLRNPEVNQEILSILNNSYIPDCAATWPPTPTSTATPTSIPTKTLTATFAPTDTPEPVSSLPGTVIERANCRYGPGAPYLYKYGLRDGTPMEIIGRDADGDWLQVQGIGGNNPCWIKGDLIQPDGDVMNLPNAYPFPQYLTPSDDFEQITLIAVSGGETVTVEWLPHEIRIDLRQEGVVKYIVEVWTCVDGKPAFYALGTDETIMRFQVDYSCGVISYADVIGQDKHGFSPPTVISLP